MKKLTYFLGIGLIGITFLLNSCSKDDAVGPDLTINSEEDVTVPANSLITIEWRADAGDAKLEFFTIKEGNLAILDFDNIDWNNYQIPNADDETFIGSATVMIGDENTAFTLIVTDKDGLTAQGMVNVTIDVGSTGNPINEYTAVLMGAQTNVDVGSFLDAETGTVYKIGPAGNNQALIDIIYYYGISSGNEATFVNPNHPTVNNATANAFDWCTDWSVKNGTVFGVSSLTSGEFDAIDDDLLISGITGLSDNIIPQMSVNDVIAFETVNSKKGLIRVTNIVAGGDGSITINVKIQE